MLLQRYTRSLILVFACAALIALVCYYLLPLVDREMGVRLRVGDSVARISTVFDGVRIFEEIEALNPRRWNEPANRMSWRACEHAGLVQFDEYRIDLGSAYDSELNQAARKSFCNYREQRGYPKDASLSTDIMAVRGPDSFFDSNIRFADTEVSEELADAIVLVQVVNTRLHWMDPGDIDLRTMPRHVGIEGGLGSRHGDPFVVAFADNEVWVLSPETPFEAIEPFLTVSNARRSSRDHLLKDYRMNFSAVWVDPTKYGIDWSTEE